MRLKGSKDFHLTYFSLCVFYRKLKLYEEQELTMQVFSEPNEIQMPPDNQQIQHNSITQNLLSMEPPPSLLLDNPYDYDLSHLNDGRGGDNTYATIQPRDYSSNHHKNNNNISSSNNLINSNSNNLLDADYATLRDTRVPSVSAFY
jgi:hypothetical protein